MLNQDTLSHWKLSKYFMEVGSRKSFMELTCVILAGMVQVCTHANSLIWSLKNYLQVQLQCLSNLVTPGESVLEGRATQDPRGNQSQDFCVCLSNTIPEGQKDHFACIFLHTFRVRSYFLHNPFRLLRILFSFVYDWEILLEQVAQGYCTVSHPGDDQKLVWTWSWKTALSGLTWTGGSDVSKGQLKHTPCK